MINEVPGHQKQFDKGLCNTSIHFTVSSDFVSSKQESKGSDQTVAGHGSLGLHCPKDRVSHGVALLYLSQLYRY